MHLAKYYYHDQISEDGVFWGMWHTGGKRKMHAEFS